MSPSRSAELPEGPAVSGAALRLLALSLYMQRIREQLAQHPTLLLAEEVRRTEHAVTWHIPPGPDAWDEFGFAQMRRAVHATKISVSTPMARMPTRTLSPARTLSRTGALPRRRPKSSGPAAATSHGFSLRHGARASRGWGLPGRRAGRPRANERAQEGHSQGRLGTLPDPHRGRARSGDRKAPLRVAAAASPDRIYSSAQSVCWRISCICRLKIQLCFSGTTKHFNHRLQNVGHDSGLF